MVTANVIMAMVFGAYTAGLWTTLGIVYVVFRKEKNKRA